MLSTEHRAEGGKMSRVEAHRLATAMGVEWSEVKRRGARMTDGARFSSVKESRE